MIKVTQNPNKEIVKKIKDKLKENDGFCPCSLIKNENTKCMCKDFREKVEMGEPYICHCGLYIIERK